MGICGGGRMPIPIDDTVFRSWAAAGVYGSGTNNLEKKGRLRKHAAQKLISSVWMNLIVQDRIPELLVFLPIAVRVRKVITENQVSRNNLEGHVQCIPVLIEKYRIPQGKTRSR